MLTVLCLVFFSFSTFAWEPSTVESINPVGRFLHPRTLSGRLSRHPALLHSHALQVQALILAIGHPCTL